MAADLRAARTAFDVIDIVRSSFFFSAAAGASAGLSASSCMSGMGSFSTSSTSFSVMADTAAIEERLVDLADFAGPSE